MSRRFTIVDIPDPTNLSVKFVYNFFVADERINASGDPRIKGGSKYLQKLIKANSLQFEVPRYVEVKFNEVSLQMTNFANTSLNSGYIQKSSILENADSEESITNAGFAALKEADESAVHRLKEKIQALSNVLGIGFESSFQTKLIATKMKVAQSDVQEVLSPTNDPSTLLVNAKLPPSTESVFDLAAQAKIHSQVNKRLMGAITNAADDTSPLSKNQVIDLADEISKKFIKKSSANSLLLSDIEPSFKTVSKPQVLDKGAIKKLNLGTDTRRIVGASVLGYVVTRHQLGDDGSVIETKNFTLVGSSNNRLIDSEILYGTTYTYEVRTVVRVDAIINADIEAYAAGQSKNKNWLISTAIASRPSNSSRVRTEEFVAPNEPDGVFYNFNYDRGQGLIVTWQIPAGRSRDVKYFQIFRRKTIFEPFTCIGMIDFDDSIIRTTPREVVKKERVITSKGSLTYFEDKTFTRVDKYIYAVTAVDAHGMSSGYSRQMEIGFDRIKNQLTYKYISRGGAPKQYPNFYVDPDLDDNVTVDSFTQDAILDSGHKKMSIYFTPDARMIVDATGKVENVFYTTSAGKSSNNVGYQVHFINVDQQKSSTVNLQIADERNS